MTRWSGRQCARRRRRPDFHLVDVVGIGVRRRFVQNRDLGTAGDPGGSPFSLWPPWLCEGSFPRLVNASLFPAFSRLSCFSWFAVGPASTGPNPTGDRPNPCFRRSDLGHSGLFRILGFLLVSGVGFWLFRISDFGFRISPFGFPANDDPCHRRRGISWPLPGRAARRARRSRAGFFPRAYPELDALGVESLQGDITDEGAVAAACSGCDTVFHIAARKEFGALGAAISARTL